MDSRASYRYCAKVTRKSSSSFYLASRYFDTETRKHLYAIYAFCRTADDIADAPGLERNVRLDEIGVLEHTLKTERYEADDLLWPAFFESVKKYNIPKKYFNELLEGMRFDIDGGAIKSLADLERYSYLVAGTVGGMCAHLVTKPSVSTIEAAIDLGIAMQITNILRDVSADALISRIYLPEDMMRQYGLKESDIRQGRFTEGSAALMAELAAIAQQKYERAEIVVRRLPKNNRRPILVALGLYREILKRIEQREFRVYNTRVRLNILQKLWLVIRTR